MSMRLNAEKATDITCQTASFFSSTLVRATPYDPDTLEPVEAWDSASNDVLEQVVETLFFYDLTDENLPRINLLAYSYHWVDTTHLDIRLREGILFHDGTLFNASAAKWNLDRLLYLTNCTGTNTGMVAQTQPLWMFPDGTTPIINNVATVGTYNLTITLNGPYGPLLNTLAYINAGMISPTAHAAEATSFIDLTTGKPIGTGPFKYEYHVPGVEVRMNRYDAYWMGPANFSEVIFNIYSDTTTAHDAFMNHIVDINSMSSYQNLAIYDADPNIIVKRFTEDTGKPSLVYQYMGINNENYNATWRKVMALATNYTYVIDVLKSGNAIRAHSAISPGFGGAYNASVVGPNFDIAAARLIMQSMGSGVGFTTEAEWTSATFLSIPYTYYAWDLNKAALYVVIRDTFDLVGINVIDDGVTLPQFPDYLGLFAMGWGPDYPDPYNMLDPLFNPASSSNIAKVNDTKLNTMMAACLAERDDLARNILYQNIQGYMADYGFFHIPLYHSKLTYVHLNEIKGVPYNAMRSFYAYPIYRATPGSFSLSSDAGSPDDDGIFDLTWTVASGAHNYSVYRSSSYITVIDGSLTLLASEIIDLTLALSGYVDGTYYFIVVAHNDNGDTLSNCIQVNVEFPGPSGDFTLSSNAGNLDTNGIFDLSWTAASGAHNYSVYRSSSFITVIDGSVTLLANEITNLTWALSEYEDGTYYFIVIAHNDYGDTLSNCIEITVGKPIIPGYDLALILLTMVGITFLLIKSKLKRKI